MSQQLSSAQLSSPQQRSAAPCRALPCGAVLRRAVPCFVHTRYHTKVPGTRVCMYTESRKKHTRSAQLSYLSGAAQRRAVPWGVVLCRAVPCFAVLSLSYVPDGNASKWTELARARGQSVLEHFIQQFVVEPSFLIFCVCKPFGILLYRYTAPA